MSSSKLSNPKDRIGATKLAFDLIPDSAIAEMSLAHLEGALKYGTWNWRAAGVRASIYVAAIRRHLAKWVNGENRDAKTRVHHLANVMACCAIIIDAELCGKLTDDRPPAAAVSEMIDALAKRVQHLKEVFKDCHPYDYTIQDTHEEAMMKHLDEMEDEEPSVEPDSVIGRDPYKEWEEGARAIFHEAMVKTLKDREDKQ